MDQAPHTLQPHLPKVRGRYLFNVPLAPTMWFRVGGEADVTFKPADLDDLCFFLQNKPADLPVSVIGVGSNLRVRDGGVPGVVVRLGRGFTEKIPMCMWVLQFLTEPWLFLQQRKAFQALSFCAEFPVPLAAHCE